MFNSYICQDRKKVKFNEFWYLHYYKKHQSDQSVLSWKYYSVTWKSSQSNEKIYTNLIPTNLTWKACVSFINLVVYSISNLSTRTNVSLSIWSWWLAIVGNIGLQRKDLRKLGRIFWKAIISMYGHP